MVGIYPNWLERLTLRRLLNIDPDYLENQLRDGVSIRHDRPLRRTDCMQFHFLRHVLRQKGAVNALSVDILHIQNMCV